jgi:L-iditol 2-dehydrogenase
MLAARLYGKEDLRVTEIPVPEIEDGDILMRVKAGTVCGTDLRMLKNGTAGVDENHPLTLCHEFAGVIERVGGKVKDYYPGQRITVAPNLGCGKCDRCVSGNSHHCSGEHLGIGVQIDGAFAEFLRIPGRAVLLGNVVVLPDSVSFAAAAANEALSCVYNAFERYQIFPGDTVLIIGAGAIGLMHAKLALMAGAYKVIMNDLSKSRLEECAAIEPKIITVTENLTERIKEETGGAGANVVITACSVAAVQQSAFALAALDGRVNFFGGLPADKSSVALDTNLIHYKQLTVTGTTRSSHRQYRTTLDFIARGLIDLDPLVTHSFPIQDVRRAFDNAAAAVGLKQAIVF